MKRIKDIALVVVISLAVAILAGEVYYRFISAQGYITPALLKARGLEYKPGNFARYILPQKEQTSRGKYYVNKLGYRGHDFSVEKQPGTIRVMTMGGSSVFDVGALDDEDWPHRVEQLLKERGLNNVEVINAGIIGYYSDRQTINLDGVVDGGALDAVKDKRLLSYLADRCVTHIAEFPFYLYFYDDYWGGRVGDRLTLIAEFGEAVERQPASFANSFGVWAFAVEAGSRTSSGGSCDAP